jgi:hypothetical protein
MIGERAEQQPGAPAVRGHGRAPERSKECVPTQGAAAAGPTPTCALCGAAFVPARAWARYCSSACRRGAWRRRAGCERCRGRVVLDAALVTALRRALDGGGDESA